MEQQIDKTAAPQVGQAESGNERPEREAANAAESGAVVAVAEAASLPADNAPASPGTEAEPGSEALVPGTEAGAGAEEPESPEQLSERGGAAGQEPDGDQVTVVGVRFRPAGKVYYFKPGGEQLAKGDDVVVETARGVEFGNVVVGPRLVQLKETVSPLRQVMRRATDEDRARLAGNRQRAAEAFDLCEQKIAEHNLPMKLIDVEFTFDVGKILFYFTSDGRVDFRELVKDLAAIFRTRIELRQIGVRDEAKLLGGLGPCGRELCCSTWLGDFEPVSIRMAKGQNLSLNPTKISGICGRLMCCLKYENDTYKSCPKRQGNCPGCSELNTEELSEEVIEETTDDKGAGF